ncbi:fimbrial biogenesis chaperone [Pseudoxanthomonas sp.]|jgi:P pilus assembly chaperone PapD|uniref:fimbrial biogenesis chaperone n=1 Tax=Pseudoxanthomonas sp. TaxID=1871049 RepID=UPI002E157385|nr:fimbria/pilus periplasmic chaperone [Pseudoxanthomonas sp.]
MRSLHKTMAAAILLAGFTAGSPAMAGITILGTRVIYDAGEKEKTVQLTNTGSTPVLAQSWIDAGAPDVDASKVKVPFALLPPLTRIEAKKGQSLRIVYTPRIADPLPADRESVFYLNVLEIPPVSDEASGSNHLQLAIRTRIKLFFRPGQMEGKPRDAAAALTWRLLQDGDASYLVAHNPSRYHVSISSAEIGSAKTETPGMVAPGDELKLKLGARASQAGPVKFEWIDDYGAAVEATATAN